MERRLEALASWQWDAREYPSYPSISSRNGYYSPGPSHAEEWPVVRVLHHISLRRAATQYRGLNVRTEAKHDPELLEYFRSNYELDVPDRTSPASPSDPGDSASHPAIDSPILPEQLPEAARFIEGARTAILVNAYERNPASRRICVEYFGAICLVCGFDFGRAYGDAARGYIHVHHLTPLSGIRESYVVDPIEDLRPVCANCHAVLHRRDPPYKIEELRQMVEAARQHAGRP